MSNKLFPAPVSPVSFHVSTSIGGSVRLSFFPLIFLIGLVAVFASFGLLFLLSPFAASCVGCSFVGCGGVAHGLFGHVSLPLRFSNFGIVLPVWALVSMIVHIPLTIVFLCFCVVPFSYLPLVGLIRLLPEGYQLKINPVGSKEGSRADLGVSPFVTFRRWPYLVMLEFYVGCRMM